MALTLAALKTEIATDPDTLGYAGKTDDVVADLLNLVRPQAKYATYRGVLQANEAAAALVKSEWDALSAGDKQYFQTVISAGQINVSSGNIRNGFTALFGAGSQTRANLVALMQRPGSRAEVVFGAGVRVTPSDVADAKRS